MRFILGTVGGAGGRGGGGGHLVALVRFGNLFNGFTAMFFFIQVLASVLNLLSFGSFLKVGGNMFCSVAAL